MSIEKKQFIDQIEIVGPFKIVQIRKANIFLEDGVEISRSLERFVVAPGGNASEFGDEVETICKTVHTPEVIAAYQASQANAE